MQQSIIISLFLFSSSLSNKLENQDSNATYDLKDYLHLLRDGIWQPVGYTTYRFFVYSAFLEWRQEPAVRVIAATSRRLHDQVLCKLLLPSNRTVTLEADIQIVREHSYRRYSAAFILCHLETNVTKTLMHPLETIGAFVAIVTSAKPDYPPLNLLQVLNTVPEGKTSEGVHICLRPLHSVFSRKDWLIEWLEMNQILGVSHFYIYNESLSSEVSCLLDDYKKKGLVTILPWKLPFAEKAAIESDFAALNDCLYRSMAYASWLLVLDVDELVIPRNKSTLPDLINSLNNGTDLSPAQVLFRHAFFFTQWKDDWLSEYPLLTMLKTRRSVAIHKVFNRNKYAVRPQYAYELGTNFAWKMLQGSKTVRVTTDEALLHHYRVWSEADDTQCLDIPSMRDSIAHRWEENLMSRVGLLNQLFDNQCSKSDLDTEL